MMTSFYQRAPAWAQKLIPGSNLTIGRYGCTITCIADLSTYFGENIDPAQTADLLNFTEGGLIIWASVKFPTFRFVKRQYGRFDNNISAALLDPDSAVILQVANQSHWVVATGFSVPGKIYNIADPWLGDRSNMRRYQNNITGAAYFERL